MVKYQTIIMQFVRQRRQKEETDSSREQSSQYEYMTHRLMNIKQPATEYNNYYVLYITYVY